MFSFIKYILGFSAATSNNSAKKLQQESFKPVTTTGFQLVSYDTVKAGESAFSTLQNRQNNHCWRSAISSFDTLCREFSMPDKQRLALALTNCHLKDSSRQQVPCSKSKEPSQCIATIRDDSTFGAFTAFFIQVDHSCQFLQSEQWQANTEYTINALQKTATETLHKQSELIQQSIATFEQLQRTVYVTETIAENVNTVINGVQNLSDDLQTHAQESAQAHMTALKQGREISAVIADIYGFIQNVDSIVLRLSNAWYFLWSLNVSFVLTSVAATRYLRPSLLTVCILTAATEYFLYYDMHRIRRYTWWLAAMICMIQIAAMVVKNIYRSRPTKEIVDINMYSNMNRKQLQILAKQKGIAANKSNKEIVQSLKQVAQ
jgi:hypothetical protein